MKIKRFLSAALAAAILLIVPQTSFAAEPQQIQFQTDVPKFHIDTADCNGASLQKSDGYVSAHLQLTDESGTLIDTDISVKVRGNTTALSWVKKKAFNVKFPTKQELFDMGKGKKWVLLANTFDSTFVRNFLAFDTAQELGLAYTSKQRICELWLDGNYRGCYTLMEPVQEGKDRVNIDISKGKDFLLEVENVLTEEGETYITVDKTRYCINEPEEPDDEEVAYITEVMERVTSTLKTGSEKEIREAIDVPSFAAYYVLNEYLKTFDFDRTSTRFYYQDGKLFAGPPWDYDISTGNSNPDYSARAKGTYEPEGLFCNNKIIYKNLCSQDWFNAEVQRVYNAHRAWFDNLGADGGYTDTFRATYAEVIDRNYSVAGWDIGKWWINHQLKPKNNYEDNYLFLKEWLQKRSEWLDLHFDSIVYYLRGDADGNGIIDINDVTFTQRLLAELETDPDGMATLRANLHDETLTIDDATSMQEYLAEIPNDCKVGETRHFDKE